MSESTSDAAPFGPTASLAALRARAEILLAVRSFFRDRGVLEVETPLLCAAGAVDEHLDPVPVSVQLPGSARPRSAYLVTSPEHSMKRLLAAGAGPIYQITRAFRDGERGRLHNPEFTILEWYRPGFDERALMDEVESLVRVILPRLTHEAEPFERITYRDAFQRGVGVDPFDASLEELARLAEVPARAPALDRDALLNLLLVRHVEAGLGVDRPSFLHDYPASQAALARTRGENPAIAARFELYVRGIELANGYHELLDAAEQERRFRAANARRRAAEKPELPIDHALLRALVVGMPPCAGVAMGIDRIVLLAVCATSIDEVIAFPIERA